MGADRSLRAGWVLASGVLLQACGVTPGRGGFLRYSFDSPSAACRHSVTGCVALYGKEIASVGAVLKGVLDLPTRSSIDRALAECADEARSEVLQRHEGEFAGFTPTTDECNQLANNPRRKGMTWAMQLGTEMHELALECTEGRLNELRPGGFNLEQRYRYDSSQGRWKLVSREEERALEESGNAAELRGSLEPDVVIHQGDPLNVQEVYDFNFPCVNTDIAPKWTQYPSGHPYAESHQGQMYEWVFAVKPVRVVPRLGVIRDE